MMVEIKGYHYLSEHFACGCGFRTLLILIACVGAHGVDLACFRLLLLFSFCVNVRSTFPSKKPNKNRYANFSSQPKDMLLRGKIPKITYNIINIFVYFSKATHDKESILKTIVGDQIAGLFEFVAIKIFLWYLNNINVKFQ